MKDKIYVLQVISSLGMGGAETWLVQVLKYWNAQGYSDIQMDFVITNGNKALFDEEVESLGSRIFYIQLSKNTTREFIVNFRKILANTNYSAIHDHQDFLSGWHFLFGIGLLPKVRIAHVHNPSYQLIENYGINYRRRLTLKIGQFLLSLLSTHIKGTSNRVLKEYGITKIKYPNQEISSLHCSFSPSKWLGDYSNQKQQILNEFALTENTKIVLFAGRLDYSLDPNNPRNHKNSAFALDIIHKCKNEHIVMLMAGANQFIAEEFNEAIEKKGLINRVKLIGIRKDLNNLMIGSDLLLFPSRAEGLGMVAVEAQAAGLPVLASTNVPDECLVINEIVYFMELSSYPSEWAEKVEEILSRPRLGSTCFDDRWKTSEFNIEVSSKKLLSLYFPAKENI